MKDGQQQSIAGELAQAKLGRPESGQSAIKEVSGQSKASASMDDRQCRSPSAVPCSSAAEDDREEEPDVSCEPANSARLVATESLKPDTSCLENAGRGEVELLGGNAHLSASESDQGQ